MWWEQLIGGWTESSTQTYSADLLRQSLGQQMQGMRDYHWLSDSEWLLIKGMRAKKLKEEADEKWLACNMAL